MEIGILDIKNALPLFERFGNLPTCVIDETNYKLIKDLDMLIIPGGSLIEGNFSNRLERYILDYEGLLLGICSGFQILSEGVDIGRKSPTPIFKEGLGLLNVRFFPLICTDRVKFESTVFKCDEGTGFHCHTYGNIEITNKDTDVFTYSYVNKLNYKMMDKCEKIISGAYYKNVFGTMVHNFLDNDDVKRGIFKYLGCDDEDIIKIYEKNKDILRKLWSKSVIYENIINNWNDINNKNNKNSNSNNGDGNNSNNNNSNNNSNDKNNNSDSIENIIDNLINSFVMDNCFAEDTNEDNTKKDKKGIILLSTSSDSGKTFLTTALASKLDRRTFVSKIGPDVRDIVPALYLLREPMLKYSSIKIGDRGWCDVKEYINFVKSSNYEYFIIEGVMGAFTGALNKKNYSGAEISRILNFPVYVISSCNKSGIEGSVVDSIAYYKLLKKMDVNVKGIVLNKVYNFDIFEKVKKILSKYNIPIIGVPKIKKGDDRGNIPEVEIDYSKFCQMSRGLDFNLPLEKIDFNLKDEDGKLFEEYLEEWIGDLL